MQDWVYVYPQRCGTGLQTKVQQAMACGLPVVGYDCAFSGIDVRSGENCLVCTSPEEIAAAVTSLMRDASLRTRIGRAAADYVRKEFAIDRVGESVMSIYRHLIRVGAGDSR